MKSGAIFDNSQSIRFLQTTANLPIFAKIYNSLYYKELFYMTSDLFVNHLFIHKKGPWIAKQPLQTVVSQDFTRDSNKTKDLNKGIKTSFDLLRVICKSC